MKSFKEIMQSDVSDVFLNTMEFADIHLVDGKRMSAIVDDSELIEREKKQLERTDGIYKRQFIIYVSKKDFGAVPAVGRLLSFDKNNYKIIDVAVEGDMYSITLGVNRA